MKKLLSVVLALALCLTAMMGCFAVSAETVATKATINIAGGEAIKAGETATVTVTGSDFTDVCAADLVITLPAGFELVSVSEAGEVLVNDDNGVYYVYNETANTVKYIDVFNFNDEVKALDLALVVTAPADAENGEYAVTGAVVAANIDEEFLGVTINNGAITVQNEVAHEHVWEYTYSVDGANCVTTGTCECGETTTIATIANISTAKAPIVAEGLAIKFRVLATDVTGYSDLSAVFTKTCYNKNTVIDPQIDTLTAFDEVVSKKDYKTFLYTGIASYEMTSNIHLSVYGKDAEGNTVLLSDSDYALVDYLNANYTNKYFPASLKTWLGDIANYGAYAQIASDYNTNNLANANTPAGLASELPTTFENTTNVSSGISIKAAPTLGNSVTIKFRVLKSDVDSLENLSMTIDYIDAYGNAQVFDASDYGTISSVTVSKKEYWQVEFNKLVAAHVNDTLTVKLFADGSDEAIGTLQYGFEAYAESTYNAYKNSSQAFYVNLSNLCRAVVAYGRSAAANN